MGFISRLGADVLKAVLFQLIIINAQFVFVLFDFCISNSQQTTYRLTVISC